MLLWCEPLLTVALSVLHPSRLDLRSTKAMIVALGFILEKAAKNKCSAEDLEKEMLQLGMSADHSRQLFTVYQESSDALYESLTRNFIKC